MFSSHKSPHPLIPFFPSDLNRKAKSVKNCKAKIELLGSYDPQKQLIIKDPYYASISVKSEWLSAHLRCFLWFGWYIDHFKENDLHELLLQALLGVHELYLYFFSPKG